MTADLIFFTSTKLHEHTIKFHNQGLSCLLLVDAFPKPTAKPYKHSGTLMETWPTSSWLCVAVQLRSAE